MIELGVLAVALAMDATAACASVASSARSLRPVLVAAGLFGAFQAGMSGAGWWGGAAIVAWAGAWDHWVAFVLLVGIGLRAIHEGMSHDGGERPETSLGALVVLAFATSLDALAAGVTLPLLSVGAPVAVGVIGVVTAALSLLGGWLGHRLGDRLGPSLDIVGGVVLIALGLKILVEHLAVVEP